MLAWWPGNGNAKDVISGSEGLLKNGTTFAPGVVEQAFSFDGIDDYIDVGKTPVVVGKDAFTIDMWVKTNSGGVLINQRDPNAYNGEYYLGISEVTGKVYWLTYGDWAYGFDFRSNQSVNDGQFHFITATREANGEGRIYIDGQLDSLQASPPRTMIPLNVYLGGDYRDEVHLGQGYYYQGLMDEVQIYTQALPLNEIQALYLAKHGGTCKKPEDSELRGYVPVVLSHPSLGENTASPATQVASDLISRDAQ